MGRLITIIGWIGIILFILIVGGGACVFGFVFLHEKCGMASDDVARGLVPQIAFIEKHAFAGVIERRQIDPKLRVPGLVRMGNGEYGVSTRKASRGYEVVIAPKRWCFCRITYILRDGGNELDLVEPLLKL